jgi:hypothetical protein
VIWAQQSSIVRMADGFAVKEVNRVGIRMYLSIGRGGVPPTNFTISAITGHRSASGRPYLTALVHDTGGLAVDLDGTVRLAGGPGGTSAGPFSAQQVTTLAPGQSWTMTFAPGPRIPTGPWTATITLVSGLTRRTAAATIQFSSPTPHHHRMDHPPAPHHRRSSHPHHHRPAHPGQEPSATHPPHPPRTRLTPPVGLKATRGPVDGPVLHP